MAGLLIQPEGLLRFRSISSALVIAVENKPGDGLPSKRSFYCKPILDFIETRVCSLVYKFAFSIDCIAPTFRTFRGRDGHECSSVLGFASRIGLLRVRTSPARSLR